MRSFDSLLKASVERHGHLCAGQVLGVRMALRGLAELDLDPDLERKRIVVYVEIDRCAADAIASVSGCSLGKRTLKYVDYGKMAATFVDTLTQRAVRIAALDSARELTAGYASAGLSKEAAQLAAYQAAPDSELFDVQNVQVVLSPFDLPGRPLRRVSCACCGEGINDGRELVVDGKTFCRACASGAYYEAIDFPTSEPAPLHDPGESSDPVSSISGPTLLYSTR